MSVRLDHGDDALSEVHEINVTPFIDVILVLLIIFMIAAPLATVDISVDLPAANAERTPRPDKPLFLTLKSDLSLALDNDQIARAAFAATLDKTTSGDKQQRVFLRADKTVPYGELMSLMNELRMAGYLHVALVGLEGEKAMTAGRAESFRWAACFALALCFHGAGAAVLLAKWSESSDLVANAPVIMIDLAPVAVAPEIIPNEMPPDQVASRAEEPEPEPEKPVEKVELQPPEAPKPEVALPPPPPKKVEKPKEKPKKKSIARAPSSADQRADVAAAPLPGASSRDSNAMPNWKSQLVARLERYKRYPSEAQSRGEGGVAQLAFSIDRSGGVHNARIVRSSGSSMLDRETLALVERAQPLPPPPPEMGGSQVAIVVPIRYNMR